MNEKHIPYADPKNYLYTIYEILDHMAPENKDINNPYKFIAKIILIT